MALLREMLRAASVPCSLCGDLYRCSCVSYVQLLHSAPTVRLRRNGRLFVSLSVLVLYVYRSRTATETRGHGRAGHITVAHLKGRPTPSAETPPAATPPSQRERVPSRPRHRGASAACGEATGNRVSRRGSAHGRHCYTCRRHPAWRWGLLPFSRGLCT